MSQPLEIHKFDLESQNEWRVVNDGVMGGLSQGEFLINEEGNGIFRGHVSLDNNGGFTSIRSSVDQDLSEHTKIVLKVKGDGKRYQLRLKKNSSDYQSYIQYFNTSGDWQTIELALEDFYPSFRGRKLSMPNYSPGVLKEISILIANYKEEDFQLELDHIRAE